MKYFVLFALLLLNLTAYSQSFNLTGKVQSAEDGSTFPGATVAVMNASDSAIIGGGVTDFNGDFLVKDLSKGTYLIKVGFVGFQSLIDTIKLEGDLDLGTLILQEETQVLGAVEVVAKPAATIQKGDTVQFSAAAYKTARDASTQELVEKLPGITQENGKLQANGEDIQMILVDGKPFFGGDVSAALQNLPAEIVASIQVFDRKSDKARLSGFDDGEQIKTINIVTKPNRRRGQFGKSTVGIGTANTYHAGASVNFFNDERRITVTGLSNNINTVNYSADANDIGEAQSQNGLINTNSLGINYNDDWGDKMEFNGSYRFSNQDRTEQQNMLRDYAVDSDSGQVYKEDRTSTQLDNQHNLRFRLRYEDPKNTFLIRPNFSFQFEERGSDFIGETSSGNREINSTRNIADGSFQNFDYSSNIYYNRKFDKEGRSVTTRFQTGYHPNKDLSSRYAENNFYNETDSVSIFDQETTRDRLGLSWEGQVSYTEPLSEKSMMEFEYQISNKLDDSDKITYNLDESRERSEIDTTISNTFDSRYQRHDLEIGYQYNTEKFLFQFETEYQVALLDNSQEFPKPFDQSRTFTGLLPSARVKYQFSEDKRMELNYQTWTDRPSIAELQDVIDNSNPLQLTSGNPNLDQAYYHRGKLRFWSNNIDTEKSIYVSMQSIFARNLITTSSIIADAPVEIADGVMLEEGSQFRSPINANGYISAYYYMSYGEPLHILKSNYRINGGVRYSRRPGQINEVINYSNAHNYWMGLSLTSNISEDVDFNISTRSRYHVIENTVRPSLDNTYYTHSTRLKYRWVLLGGFVYRANVNHQLNTGLSEGYDNSSLLVNMSAGKKFLKNDLAEISINVYDLFQQNNNVGRSINELFIEDRQTTVLQRYFMLTFTYNIRNFSPGTSLEDYEDI